MSVDVLIADPSKSQNLDRYSYAVNNPLRYLDPTGLCQSDASDVNKLDCTVQDFDHMTADQRIAWLHAFAQKFGYGGTFNSISAVIQYFRDSNVIDFRPMQGWASAGDAAVLLAIQDGQVHYEFDNGLSARRPTYSGPDIGLHDSAATNWAAFFDYYHNHGGDWDTDNHKLLSLYGNSEQAGENFGSVYADQLRGHPAGVEGAVIDAFVAQGNSVRSDQRNGDFGFLGVNDPRSSGIVYAGLRVLEASTEVGYAIIQARESYPYGSGNYSCPNMSVVCLRRVVFL